MDRREFEIAEAVRRTCLDAAREAFEDAGLSGLCAEGRCEAALGAIAALDLHAVVGSASNPPAAASRPGPADAGRD